MSLSLLINIKHIFMEKIIVTFWFGDIYPVDKQVYDKQSSSFLTVRFTPPTEIGSHFCFQVCSNGVCIIPCGDYTILGSRSAVNWTDHFSLEFSGNALAVVAKGRDMLFDMPTVEEYWCLSKKIWALLQEPFF